MFKTWPTRGFVADSSQICLTHKCRVYEANSNVKRTLKNNLHSTYYVKTSEAVEWGTLACENSLLSFLKRSPPYYQYYQSRWDELSTNLMRVHLNWNWVENLTYVGSLKLILMWEQSKKTTSILQTISGLLNWMHEVHSYVIIMSCPFCNEPYQSY